MNRERKTFNVNIKRLALLTMPSWLRRPLCGALMFAGIIPLWRLIGELRQFRKEISYRLTHNGQVCKLRGLLNDEFDPGQRRIKIEDSENGEIEETSVIRMREVGKWVIVPLRSEGVVMTHREGFSGTSGYDFWVLVPFDLQDIELETRMRAIINMYKLACKRYTIIYQ